MLITRLILFALLLHLLALESEAPSASAESPANDTIVDAKMLGEWDAVTTNAQGTWKFHFVPQADGHFRTKITGPAVVPDDVGKLTAMNGNWSTSRANGFSDHGVYNFSDPNTVVFTGMIGTLIFNRSGSAASGAPSEKTAQPPGDPSPAVPGRVFDSQLNGGAISENR